MIIFKTPMDLKAGDVLAAHPVEGMQGRWRVVGPAVQCGDVAEIPYATSSGDCAWLVAGAHQKLSVITTPRQDVIAGLRALADFLEENPFVPVEREQEVVYFASSGRGTTDAVREVDRVAGLLGVTPGRRAQSHVASRRFHGVQYDAVAFHAYPKETA